MSTHNRRAFVLLSGGLDSTTALHQAILDYAPPDYEPGEVHKRLTSERRFDPLSVDWVEAISINYGQRHIKEAEFAKMTCDELKITHRVIDLGSILGKSMLTDESIEVPNIAYGDIKGVSPTYVPNRNMTMLSVLVAQAQLWVNEQVARKTEELIMLSFGNVDEQDAKAEALRLYKDSTGVYFGAHSEDAMNWAYPDCTPEFIGSMSAAIYIASYMTTRLHTPLQWMMKHEIVYRGAQIGVPFENTWSCYKGEVQHCGVCPTCRSRRDAFIVAGIHDPTDYANPNPTYASPDDELKAQANALLAKS
jgi:7-cyano-7-deazaguanine synthase